MCGAGRNEVPDAAGQAGPVGIGQAAARIDIVQDRVRLSAGDGIKRGQRQEYLGEIGAGVTQWRVIREADNAARDLGGVRTRNAFNVPVS